MRLRGHRDAGDDGHTIGLIGLTRLSNRTPEVERNLAWLDAREPLPLVDVFICTYNEDEAILERTIVGAASMDYGRFRVWVLDDGRRPWLEALSRRLGVSYLTRPDNAHAKAGNINNGLKHVAALAEPPDFISILDADFVPTSQFLRRALSLFREGDVGIVQTPQHFINPDPLQSNLSIAGVWPDEQRYFFDVVMASKDAWGAAFCCGTSSVIRFAELQRLGGFPTDSVTEDYLVTLRMKQGGYRTVYLNERLSLGLAPEGLKEYITQRSRWALGFMQIFRGPLGPLRRGNGLSVIDRVSLIEAFLYWFGSYAFRMLGIIVPILYLLLNVNAVQADVVTTLSYYVPHFVASIHRHGLDGAEPRDAHHDGRDPAAGRLADPAGGGARPDQAEGPEVQGHGQGRRPQPAPGAMAAAQHVPDLPRPDHRRRGVGVPDRGRNQAARLQRAVPVLELVQYDRADHRLHGVHRAAALSLGRTPGGGR